MEWTIYLLITLIVGFVVGWMVNDRVQRLSLIHI